jgi:hypothetical protein
MPSKQKLGDLRQYLYERYQKRSEQVKNFSQYDLISEGLEKKIWQILREFGVNYPLDFDRPPPDVYVPARQGTKRLDPKGSVVGTSPSVASDQACLTWQARNGGFMIIDHLDFIMEDPIAEEWFTITYQFDGAFNTATSQCDNTISEFGHWKFNRMVLIDGECLKACVQNTNPNAGGVFSFESREWAL